jgi:iron complex transport system ATP-binding protein
MNVIVRLKDIQFERGERAILSDVSWTIESGQHWALLGANGSGKTTLLKIITGYEWPSSGMVEVLGRKYGECNLPELRKHIGVVSSSLDCRVPGEDNALDVVTSGFDATIGLYRDYSENEFEQARQALAMANVEKFAGQKFETLSQGEKQRVLIARALVNRPALLVLDEPCNGLDPGAKERFLSDLSRLANHKDAPTMVMVTHYIEEIDPWIAWVMVLRDGEVLASGRKSETLNTVTLSRAFGMDVLVKKEGLRYTLRS